MLPLLTNAAHKQTNKHTLSDVQVLLHTAKS